MVVHAAVLEPTPPDRHAAVACNIGPAEIGRRRRFGLSVALAAVAL